MPILCFNEMHSTSVHVASWEKNELMEAWELHVLTLKKRSDCLKKKCAGAWMMRDFTGNVLIFKERASPL